MRRILTHFFRSLVGISHSKIHVFIFFLSVSRGPVTGRVQRLIHRRSGSTLLFSRCWWRFEVHNRRCWWCCTPLNLLHRRLSSNPGRNFRSCRVLPLGRSHHTKSLSSVLSSVFFIGFPQSCRRRLHCRRAHILPHRDLNTRRASFEANWCHRRLVGTH